MIYANTNTEETYVAFLKNAYLTHKWRGKAAILKAKVRGQGGEYREGYIVEEGDTEEVMTEADGTALMLKFLILNKVYLATDSPLS